MSHHHRVLVACAGNAIRRAGARTYAVCGDLVLVLDADTQAVCSVVDHVREGGGTIDGHVADVTDFGALVETAERALEDARLDVLPGFRACLGVAPFRGPTRGSPEPAAASEQRDVPRRIATRDIPHDLSGRGPRADRRVRTAAEA